MDDLEEAVLRRAEAAEVDRQQNQAPGMDEQGAEAVDRCMSEKRLIHANTSLCRSSAIWGGEAQACQASEPTG